MPDTEHISKLKLKYRDKPESTVNCRLIEGDKAVRTQAAVNDGRYAYYNPNAGGAYFIGDFNDKHFFTPGAIEHAKRQIFKLNRKGRIPDLPMLLKEAMSLGPWPIEKKLEYFLSVLHFAKENDADGVKIGEENPVHGIPGEDAGQEPALHPLPDIVASVGYGSDREFLNLVNLAKSRGFVKTLNPIDLDGIWAKLTVEGSKQRQAFENNPIEAALIESSGSTSERTVVENFVRNNWVAMIIAAFAVFAALGAALNNWKQLLGVGENTTALVTEANEAPSITIDAPVKIQSSDNYTLHPQSQISDEVIVADKITIAGEVSLPADTILIANEMRFADNSKILYPADAKPLLIAARSIIGGKIETNGSAGVRLADGRGGHGKKGGSIAVLTRANSSLIITANGGAGASGDNGARGRNGRDGRCGSGVTGNWRSNRRGENGMPGKAGGNGGAGGAFLALTSGPSITLQAQLDGGALGKGGTGGVGGNGGAGCNGLGGNQQGEPDGDRGDNGADGARGANETPLIAPVDDFEARFERINALLKDNNQQLSALRGIWTP